MAPTLDQHSRGTKVVDHVFMEDVHEIKNIDKSFYFWYIYIYKTLHTFQIVSATKYST